MEDTPRSMDQSFRDHLQVQLHILAELECSLARAENNFNDGMADLVTARHAMAVYAKGFDTLTDFWKEKT